MSPTIRRLVMALLLIVFVAALYVRGAGSGDAVRLLTEIGGTAYQVVAGHDQGQLFIDVTLDEDFGGGQPTLVRWDSIAHEVRTYGRFSGVRPYPFVVIPPQGYSFAGFRAWRSASSTGGALSGVRGPYSRRPASLTQVAFEVPLYTLLLPMLVLLPAAWRAYRLRHRVSAGHCATCGYDLRHLGAPPTRAPDARCPECGTPVPHVPDAHSRTARATV